MNDLEKHKVHDALRATLEAELSILDAMVTAAREEATSAESRPENKYDTRALEASYLAAGQGERLATLRQLVAWARGLDAAPQSAALPGALLHIQTDAGTRWLVLAPTGGPTVQVDGHGISMVSTRSPLGQALAGSERDDAVEVDGPSGTYEAEVLYVG